MRVVEYVTKSKEQNTYSEACSRLARQEFSNMYHHVS